MNSKQTVWIDTHRVTLCEMEGDFIYPMETMDQGRSAKNPVPRFSMLSGKPLRSEHDNTVRAAVWAFYLAILLTAACAVVLANWPV